MRSLAVVLILAATCAAALADDAAPAPGRYAIRPADDGFVRLDTQTGAVTHCGQQDGVWHCDILAEDTAATDARLAALAAEVLTLRQQVEALAAKLGAVENPPTKDGATKGVAVTVAPDARPPAGFSQTLLHRLFGMVRALKGEEGG